MAALAALALLATTPAVVRAAYNAHSPYADLGRRTLTTTAADVAGQTFDFVIAGGGVAGLALAARLTEWDNLTVAVIEAGGDGSEFTERIDVPGYSYLDGLTYTDYDWQYTTVVQPDANNLTKYWPRGKGLGGSGAINGLFWVRPSDVEFDAWDTLNPDGETSWDGAVMRKYMNKAENFTAPTDDQMATFSIQANISAHGTTGPIQAGFSAYIYDAVRYWVPTLVNLGFTNLDQHGGNNHGVNLTPSSLNPSNQSRSDSKAGYIDPLPPRANLVILTGYQVTSVVWNATTSGSAVAGGLTFAASATGESFEVYATKEVVLSGGTVNTPQMLQLSGVGPSDLLTGLGIDVVSDLPVGYNLQDHISASMLFNASTAERVWGEMLNTTFADEAMARYNASDYANSEWTYINEATVYASLEDINTDYATYAATATAALADNVADMAEWNALPDTVANGLKAQYEIQNGWLSSDVGQLEIILNMLNGDHGAGIQCALQHPYSRGTILINSTAPFDKPLIDPGYFGLGYDIDIMNAGFLFLRTIGATAPLSDFLLAETTPGASVTSDALNTWIKSNGNTEYHPLGTCSMLPQSSGGVVDTNLLVYGTTNLRVVDASVAPLHVSAHLMQMTYGIAERAADLLKAKYAAEIKTTSSSTTKGASSSSSSAAAGTTAGSSSAAAASTTTMSAGTRNAVIGGSVGGAAALAAIGLLALVFARKRKAKAAAEQHKSFYASPDDAWDSGYAKEAAVSSAAGYGAGSSMRLDALAARSTDALDAPPPVLTGAGRGHSRPGSMGSIASYDTAGMGAAAPMEHDGGGNGGWYEPARVASPYHDSPSVSGASSPYHDGSPSGMFPQSPTAEHAPLSPGFGAQPGQIFNALHPSYR